jgi:NDP-4-keto-2,6-dideoxyhexose 3-C-methyltransferase
MKHSAPSNCLQCRICGNSKLVPVLDLGKQALTGVFPRDRLAQITEGPLQLIKCFGGDDVCGLLQLAHSYDLDEMYGENYGYRSGLNASMVEHLFSKVNRIRQYLSLTSGDLVIDIGSNDGTTLRAYPESLNLVGIDPTAAKFREYYPDGVMLIPEFFSARLVKQRFPGRKAKVVTSFSMFYDLESPMDFMREVHEILADDGIWVFEQSYMPTMLSTNSYDTVCHEHLEFYALKQIQWMATRVGLVIHDVEFNEINGGSFSVTVSKGSSNLPVSPNVQTILRREKDLALDSLSPFEAFATRVTQSKEALLGFLTAARSRGERVAALGASTKGNVLLQYCELTTDLISCVGEVNAEKYGGFTPGTGIPIVSEDELLDQGFDYLIVLPWHFKEFFVKNPKFSGMKLVFPLPYLNVVEC